MSIENGASTGTTERSVHERMINLRDLGDIEGTVRNLLKSNNWTEAGNVMRTFMDRWELEEGHEFMFLHLYLYNNPKDKSQGIKQLGDDPEVHRAVEYTWEGCVGSAAAKIEANHARTVAATRVDSVSYAGPPPKSGIAKSLEARKAPPFASYSDKDEDAQWSFIRALAPSLASPLVSVEEGRALLGTLMAERGTSFLTSLGCLTAKTAVGLLGALMMEVERVDSVDLLRSHVFCADQRKDESLLEFIDRVADRHQIFCVAYPNAVRDDVALLNRVIMCMDCQEYGVQMIMRNASNLAEARELIRTLNLPSLHAKPNRTRAGGVYSVAAVAAANVQPDPPVMTNLEEVGLRAEVDVMKHQVTEIMRAVTLQSKTLDQIAASTHSRGTSGSRLDISSGLCFECNMPGHLGRDCPKRRARHAKEKAARENNASETAVNKDFV